ncbi:alpha/beta fold hydrolase [Janthinobacterium violaceinigrum]|uniref:Alpha/beta fold hydrolase n=2 Tax=Janthinobacterium violaceinigrum TaxID=2654252 RepID=A0A6I1IRV8_9BURK|nr:alpha/beta fold hydrolase [Janthinobacterium violaceinigrum]
MLIQFLLSLCAATALPAFAALPAPAIDSVGGRQLESLTLRHATSRDVVVFENGSRATIDKWGTVPERLAQQASVFAYNRPGYGNSETATTPRDGRTIVEELRAALRFKGLAPPYVLVGHSLGGLYLQLYARAYPQEVKALVLVDALYPRMVRPVQEFPWLTRIAGQLAFSRTVWREIEHIDGTGEMVLDLPDVGKPMVRLENRPVSSTAIAVDFGAFRMDQASRDAVKALYPQAVNMVADSSHQMALTSPDVVVAAIRQVLPLATEKVALGD